MSTTRTRPTVLSGIQPSGHLTLGNYLGAIKNWLPLSARYDCYYMLVDLHAITARQDPAALRERCYEFLALYIACGLDPANNVLFVQSHVPAHARLSWVLNCYTMMGELGRMTQFKDKSQKNVDNINAGLFDYPVLMAADILLYQAQRVPVGDDQKQHLELTRDVAQRFNSLYGDTFVMPATKLPMVGARVMGLDDPTKKMSKSVEGAFHAVALLDEPALIRKKIMRATTDSNPCVTFDSAGPGVLNLLSIHQAFTGWTDDQMKQHFEGMRYGDLKKTVAEAVVAGLEPLQARYREIMAEPGYLHGVLRESAERVSSIANDTVRLVKQRMGIYTG